MNTPVRFGLILGIVVALLGYVVPIAGLHTNPVMPAVFVAAAVVVNVVCVFLALRQTAHDTAWMGQVVNALIVGAIGAALIFAGSWTMTTWVFRTTTPSTRQPPARGFLAGGLARGPGGCPDWRPDRKVDRSNAGRIRSSLRGP